MKMIFRVSLLALLSIAPVTAQSKDLTLIRQLPQRLATMKKEGHKKWDTGVTSTMVKGSDEFNQGLITILKELIGAYGSDKFLKQNEVDAYVKTLVTKLEFEKNLSNPLGLDQGTFAYQEVPLGLSVELSDAIATLVRGIVDLQPPFDYDIWHKEWEKAYMGGD
jgi:hypothetical protein